jgi:hypothetical protein
MKFTLERLTEPQIEPITLAELKRHLREFASITDADADLTQLIIAARQWVEEYTARALIDQNWQLTIDGPVRMVQGDRVGGYSPGPPYRYVSREDWLHWINRREIMLRRSPVIAITSFVSVDTITGAETAIDPTTYQLREPRSKWPRVAALFATTWTTGALKLQFRAGFADLIGSPTQGAEMVPVRFKQAMKLWIEANYDRDPKMMALLLQTAAGIVEGERADLHLA